MEIEVGEYDFDIEDRKDYVYLIHPKNLDKLNIYKIGKTYRLNSRLKLYPQESVIYKVWRVTNCDHVESEIKRAFHKFFSYQSQYGYEYFKGDVFNMIKCIDTLVVKMDKYIEEDTIPLLKMYYGGIHKIYENGVIKNIPCKKQKKETNKSKVKKERKVRRIATKNKVRNDKQETCNDCEKKFATKQGLKYHIDKKVCHKRDGIWCKYCEKEFTARSSLSRHKKYYCKRYGIKKEDIADDNTDDLDMGNNESSSLKEVIFKMQKDIDELKKLVGNANIGTNTDTFDDESTIIRHCAKQRKLKIGSRNGSKRKVVRARESSFAD